MQKQFREPQNGHERVIEIVRDTARHLADGAETFLLNDLLLRGLQFHERFLQLTIALAQIVFGLLASRQVLDRTGHDLLDRFGKTFGHEQAGHKPEGKHHEPKSDDLPAQRLLVSNRSRQRVKANLIGGCELRLRIERFVIEKMRAAFQIDRKMTGRFLA